MKISRVVPAQPLSNCSCGAPSWVQSQGKLPHKSPKNAFSIPNPWGNFHGKGERDTHRFSGETSGSNFSIISLGSSRGTERSSKRQKKISLNSATSQGFCPVVIIFTQRSSFSGGLTGFLCLRTTLEAWGLKLSLPGTRKAWGYFRIPADIQRDGFCHQTRGCRHSSGQWDNNHKI